MRVGLGTDVHAFDASRPLWLGCIEWPGEIGLAGHSDADAAAHAICDAMLSAAGLGDMGSNFGVSRPEYANASGATFLNATLDLVTQAGFAIGNISVQIIGNSPKVAKRRDEMQAALSAALGGAVVSVSGTTTDGLGMTGRGEGLAAIAVCLLTA
ncbi:MAG: 2-C-methyl-D-erythritol 2,4-cyclodiphosphate synthase [Actinomycetota bacterium]|jgi:2-C-methyl-D-erythritol 2,4-cyclodiphosphate synthase